MISTRGLTTLLAVRSFAGKLLVSTPKLVDPNFWRTVILILHHDENGGVGLVLNRPTLERVSDHLEDWAATVAERDMVFYGGPVEPEMGIALTTSSQSEAASLPGVYLADMTEDPPSTGETRIYSGYTGWASGQLEAEVAEGSWYVVPASPDDPFGEPEKQWTRILRRQRGHLSLVSTFPIDASLN